MFPSRSHQVTAPAPRFESSRCFLDGASGETKASCCTTSKWQIQLRRCRYPLSGGNGACAVGGMITPPKGSPQRGAPSGRFFGDFLIGEKVTRGAGRSAPSWGVQRGSAPRISGHAGAPAPAKPPRGTAVPPSTYTPKRTKSCIPTCNHQTKKSPLRGEKSALRSSWSANWARHHGAKKARENSLAFLLHIKGFVSGAFDIPSRSRAPCCGCA